MIYLFIQHDKNYLFINLGNSNLKYNGHKTAHIFAAQGLNEYLHKKLRYLNQIFRNSSLYLS